VDTALVDTAATLAVLTFIVFIVLIVVQRLVGHVQ
jgi:hypothetical protein